VLGEAVVERGVAGDAATFEAFAARKLDPSYRIAALIIGNAADAEDVTHDAFVAAWRAWSTLRDPDRLDAWFGRILINRCREHLRRGRRGRVVDISQELLELPAAGDHAVEFADREALARGFARLDPDRRICLVLRYYGDLSVREIADQTGIAEGTVKSRLHYGLRELRISLVTDAIGGPA